MKLGLALSGGGLRGAAHVGVLQALLEHEIRPDMIAGTSAGSVVAALYATGMKPKEMVKLVPEINSSLIDYNLWELVKYIFKITNYFPGFVKGDRLEDYLQMLTKAKKLFETDIPLGILAADVETGCKVIYCSQELALPHQLSGGLVQLPVIDPIHTAVRASCAIPIIFKCLKIYGRHLVDGGIKENVPVNLLKLMGADKIIAVNLGFAGERDRAINTPWEYLMQVIDIMGNELSRFLMKEADYVIDPCIYNVSSTDFSQLESHIEKGYNATSLEIEKIKEVIQKS